MMWAAISRVGTSRGELLASWTAAKASKKMVASASACSGRAGTRRMDIVRLLLRRCVRDQEGRFLSAPQVAARRLPNVLRDEERENAKRESSDRRALYRAADG